MKLLGVRLHPFGKFADASWDLTRPLVIVHGPNEAGKSTLRHAIVNALFTPAHLTPARLKQTMQPWFPLPSGDYVAVTLTFEHEGTPWTLAKRWGVGAATSLSDGATTMAEPDAVQAKLAAMLAHDEATFRHVLFTGQAELERTLESIQVAAKAGSLRDIRDVMKAAADTAGDVDEQKLRRLLKAKLEAAISRWDDARERPQRQDGQERDCRNPWKKDVGVILEAWYGWQRLVDERDAILTIEQEIDRANIAAAAVAREIHEQDAFVRQYGNLRGELADRGQLEERVPRLEQQVGTLRQAFAAWPSAGAAIDSWKQQRPGIESQLTSLGEERRHADARRAGGATAAAFAAIKDAKAAWEYALERASARNPPGDDAIAEIARLEKAITHAESGLAARTLTWRIASEKPDSATVTRGDMPPEVAAIGPSGVSGDAQGIVVVQVAGVTFSVASGGDDVAALLASLGANRTKLSATLAACGAGSADEARGTAQACRDSGALAATKHQIYEGLLRGKSFSEWEEEAHAVATLPATRDVGAIDAEITKCQNQLAKGDADAKSKTDAITQWSEQFNDVETLGFQLLEAQGELKNAKERLAAMPDVPPGFESVKAFLDALDRTHASRNEAEKRLAGTGAELARLTEKLGDRRGEDVTERAEAARRVYERTRATAHAYQRILAELDRIMAETNDDPVNAYADTVADLFSRMTGDSATLDFAEGQVPMSVARGAVALGPERLSQGGAGALALAVRLAMAEAYLAQGDGFIMLDDPLVHFDASRMAMAAEIIRQFSGRSQVIYFTCHDHHAEALSRPLDQARA